MSKPQRPQDNNKSEADKQRLQGSRTEKKVEKELKDLQKFPPKK